jgi:hypothetical protein
MEGEAMVGSEGGSDSGRQREREEGEGEEEGWELDSEEEEEIILSLDEQALVRALKMYKLYDRLLECRDEVDIRNVARSLCPRVYAEVEEGMCAEIEIEEQEGEEREGEEEEELERERERGTGEVAECMNEDYGSSEGEGGRDEEGESPEEEELNVWMMRIMDEVKEIASRLQNSQ